VCTALWLTRSTGYELFFNRDESVLRGVARAPERLVLDGVRCLAPLDADGGGTWLGVNQFGLALGLLNGRDVRAQIEEARSRGLLVRELLSARDGAEVAERMQGQGLERYRAFMLAVFEPGREPEVHDWDGREVRRGPAQRPLASSSLDRGRAQIERSRAFERMAREHGAVDMALLSAFQASHQPERGPWSPCMHRAEASTVSASRVSVDAGAVAFRYAPGPPCTSTFGPALLLERAR